MSVSLLREGEHLTKREAQVLELLIRQRPRVVPSGEIFESVWGVDLSDTSNSLRMIIGSLRRKLADPARLRTVRSFGYVHDSEPPVP